MEKKIVTLLQKEKFTEALANAKIFLKESTKTKNKEDIGIANYLVGASLYELKRFSIATKFLEQSINYFEQTKNNNRIYAIAMMYGTCLIQSGEFKLAQAKYERALKVAVSQKNVDLEIRVRINIANLLSEMGDAKSAVAQLENCLMLAKKYNKDEFMGVILGNLAGNMSIIGEIDKTIEILNEAIQLFKQDGDLHGEGRSCDLLATMYLRKNVFEQAEKCNKRANELFTQLGAIDGIAFVTNGLSKIYDAQDKIPAAIETCQLAMKMAQDNEFKLLEINCTDTLATLYEKNGDYQQAIDFLRQYIQLNSKVLSKQTNRQVHQKQEMIEQLYAELETERKELENAEMRIELEHLNRELTAKAVQMVQKTELTNLILAELNRLEVNNIDALGIIKNITNKINFENSTKHTWTEFEKWFTKVHNTFFQNLDNVCPGLTHRYRELAVYLKLGMTTKQIASLMHISHGSVAQYRIRFRKKLKLNKGEKLTNFFYKL
ncbi:MAG: tetratricopeptide repeat protein [Candidatus Cloacimonetes bacterium]|mgnify:CR=1 FL=1|jgi:tetratricopeptide (TPR) repeat protein/DNA-binding CsgD family transcriptional regulator|nr:tetratricopeptide repeat protein [Candidatus Cloacimonadota bacterium]MBT7470052.1 tetratricopeptide repeat protein [Candidatus Cloacimonadota bacterium]